jgi:hypothetical protein
MLDRLKRSLKGLPIRDADEVILTAEQILSQSNQEQEV